MIEFGPLESVDTTGELTLRMRIAALFSSIVVGDDEGIMVGRLRAGFAGAGVQASTGGPDIITPTTTQGVLNLTGVMEASLDVTAEMNGSIGLQSVMYGGEVVAGDTQVYMAGRMRLRGGMAEVPQAQAFAFMLGQSPSLTIHAGVTYERVSERVEAELESSGIPLIGLRERARFLFAGQTALVGIASITQGIGFADAMAVVLRELVEEGFEFNGDLTDNYTAIGRVMDALMLAGSASTQLEARNAIVVALAMQVLLDMFAKEQLTDSVAFNAAAGDVLVAMQQLVDGILLEASTEATATIGTLVRDTLGVEDEPATALEAHTAIRDSIAFTLRLNLDSGEYVAYVMNTVNKALSSYTQFPFNSFASFNGTDYGMTPDGIRRLGGADDDGEAINSRFRLAFTNLGTGALKRMRAAYLGLTSTGDLRLKVIVVNPNDKKREAHYYRLRATPSDGPVPVRMKIGEGLRTVYWGFEVESIDGVQWVIDQMQLFPIILEQRMDGEGGGKR